MDELPDSSDDESEAQDLCYPLQFDTKQESQESIEILDVND